MYNIPYKTEREGQIEFFDNFNVPYNDNDSILIDNTDGVYAGNIFEFKLNIGNLNKVLFQAIKYLSKMRVKGESIPATILLVDLNQTTIYVYKSKVYFKEIHKIYTGAASKENQGFIAGKHLEKLDYSTMIDASKVRKLLKEDKPIEEMYMPIDIDENCIVGWAERYYREKPTASKGDFLGDDTGTAVKVIGEIRDPRHFKGLINPYKGETNEKFRYLMDCLNDRLSKKSLGSFYTPMPYSKKASELVMQAVEGVLEGNDYIILDRCAGTGSLEEPLANLYDKNGDSLISHCVVSTYEYYEWKVMSEMIGDKVREIIPPSEANVVYENGKISNADAMSKDFIENPIIKQYVDDPKCTIILYENPPFSEASTVQTNKSNGRYQADWKRSFVAKEMKKEISGSVTNDLSNVFIWSAYHYYIRQTGDSYIVFSPLKYWRYQNLINRIFYGGFIFNRKHFHASPSAVACCSWGYENQDYSGEKIEIGFEIYDIVYDKMSPKGDLIQYTTSFLYGQQITSAKTDIFWIGKVINLLSKLYDKRRFPLDAQGVVCSTDGYETTNKKTRGRPIFNDNILGYLVAQSFGFENPRLKTNLTRIQIYNGNGFYLRNDNYLEKLPLFVAGKYPVEDEWFRNGTVCTTSDMGDVFKTNKQFLKLCLIYTCLSYYNKCLSFHGSDGRFYQNELCFDDHNEKKPLALMDLAKFGDMDEDEEALLLVWRQILELAKETKNYNPEYNYGVYQITKELNTSRKEGTGKNKKTIYDYPELNGALDTLKSMLKQYYKTHITEKMFEYELLK